ncbi:hypothetical protein PMI09_00343 [Rhizobium sp. CF122]|nr:hypothetical protein PMI09_00343 [Rhizobium sp. CF122]
MARCRMIALPFVTSGSDTSAWSWGPYSGWVLMGPVTRQVRCELPVQGVDPEQPGFHSGSASAGRVSRKAEHVGHEADGGCPGRCLIDIGDGGLVAELRQKADQAVLKRVGVGLGDQAVEAIAPTLALDGVIETIQSGQMFTARRRRQRRFYYVAPDRRPEPRDPGRNDVDQTSRRWRQRYRTEIKWHVS